MMASPVVGSWTWPELRQQMEKTVACYVEGTQQMGQTGCGEAGLHRAEDG